MVDNYIPLVPAPVITIREIFSVHYFEYTSDYVFAGEQHDFWEFCYVDKGEIDLVAGDTSLVLQKPQIIFHRPGEFHSLKANGTVAPNLVVASFSCNDAIMQWFGGKILTLGDAGRSLLARMIDEAAGAFLSPLDDPELKQLERSINAPPGSEQMVKLCLESLLIELYRNGQQPAAQPQRPTSLIKEKTQQDFIDNVVTYMESNMHKRLTLADICRDNLVGRSHLQKIFREKTGGGAMEYFGRLKIEAAKRMIREGKRNFTEVSAALGYNSIHYFSRHFKKVTGMTPSEYASSVKVLTGRSRMQPLK
ncbi:MAG: helix-turn-helix domain-containing protein [Oscillospiraceae bacterium]